MSGTNPFGSSTMTSTMSAMDAGSQHSNNEAVATQFAQFFFSCIDSNPSALADVYVRVRLRTRTRCAVP